jgi:hypothetical protein
MSHAPRFRPVLTTSGLVPDRLDLLSGDVISSILLVARSRNDLALAPASLTFNSHPVVSRRNLKSLDIRRFQKAIGHSGFSRDTPTSCDHADQPPRGGRGRLPFRSRPDSLAFVVIVRNASAFDLSRLSWESARLETQCLAMPVVLCPGFPHGECRISTTVRP